MEIGKIQNSDRAIVIAHTNISRTRRSRPRIVTFCQSTSRGSYAATVLHAKGTGCIAIWAAMSCYTWLHMEKKVSSNASRLTALDIFSKVTKPTDVISNSVELRASMTLRSYESNSLV